MAAKKKTPALELVSVVTEEPRKELILEGDPEAQLAFASKAANALMTIVSKKKDPVMIRGKQYLEYGDWQVLGRFYGATVQIEWTNPLKDDDGKIMRDRNNRAFGYEARALVLRGSELISSAENMCTRDEERWRDADDYAVRSMAQTRTAAKALRNAYGWVAELAGYKATPAGEIPDEESHEPMPPYTVEQIREQELADDERVARNDEDREAIKEYLNQLGIKPKNLTQARRAVEELTGLLFFEENYSKIRDLLRIKVDSKDPIAEFLKEE